MESYSSRYTFLSSAEGESSEEIERRIKDYDIMSESGKCAKMDIEYSNERLIELIADREKLSYDTFVQNEKDIKAKKGGLGIISMKTRDNPPIVISEENLKYDIKSAGEIADEPLTMHDAFGQIVKNWISKETISNPIGVHDMYIISMAKSEACLKDSVKNYLNSLQSYAYIFINIVKQNIAYYDEINAGITKQLSDIKFSDDEYIEVPNIIEKIKYIENVCEKYMDDYKLISSNPNSAYMYDGCKFKTIHKCLKCGQNINRPYVIYTFNKYVWDSDLVHYIKKHYMEVNSSFIACINNVKMIGEHSETVFAQQFEKVKKNEIDIEKLKANVYGYTNNIDEYSKGVITPFIDFIDNS
jgi:hypothetical protein